jgi:uncharacterized protein (DUF488 family)
MTTVYTVGHSTHSLEDFVRLLVPHSIELVADVRTIAKSRHNPQFGEDQLVTTLPAAGIDYRRFERLGGLRKTSAASINGAWRNTSFRGYADYMQTEDFSAAIDELLEAASGRTVAIMCAEAVPWRCHRSLVGDALLVRGVEVLDIMSPTSAKPEKLTSFASVEGTTVTYPPEPTDAAAPPA